MTIRQLTVFLENKPGYLNEMLETLAVNEINIIALTIADTTDYGIVRLIVSNPDHAIEKLREKRHTVRIHDVLSLELDTTPGSLYRVLQHFSDADIGMEYLYAFSYEDRSIAVMRTDNREKAVEVIKKNNLKPVSF